MAAKAGIVNAMSILTVPSVSFPVVRRTAVRFAIAAGTPTTASVYARLPPQPTASCTPTVNANEPVLVLVPEITPAEDRPSPGGKDPKTTENANGAVPAVADNVWE